MPKIEVKTVSVYVFRLIESGPEYLALHRREGIDRLGGTWQSVHGGIEEGEMAVEAAVRELHEESGLDSIGFWQLDLLESFFIYQQDSVGFVPAFAAQVDGDVVIGSEHDDFKWAALEEIKGLFVWRNQRTAIQELHDSIAMPLHQNESINKCLDVDKKYW
jgi:8-oxo-dGTP pyrophosphatase MutT (NUDIX family)